MNLFKAIIALDKEENILIDKQGSQYQKINNDLINKKYSKTSEKYKDGYISSSLNHIDFIKDNLENEFEIELQFYQKSMNFPMLCKVKTPEWNNYKIICFKSYSNGMFNTGFGESYIVNHNNEIIPLTNEEIESFKSEE